MKKSFSIFLLSVFVLLLPSLVQAATANPNSPIIQMSFLNQDPAKASAGDVVTVRLMVQNIGDGDANNLLIEAIPDFPFSMLAGKDVRQVIPVLPKSPAVAANAVITYEFKISGDASQGNYNLNFQYSLNNGAGWTTVTFPIDVTSKQFAQLFYVDKSKILPGAETPVVFTVTNVGNAPLRNLVFSWKEPNNFILPAGTDNTRYIKSLEAGQSIDLNYTVIASLNANPDLYTLNLNLQYNYVNENGTSVKENINSAAGMYVGGETDFDVAFSESSQGQTSLSISNVGSNPAQSVTVSVPQQPGFMVTGSTDSIVGNLNKGDYTVVSFQIEQINSSGIGYSRQNSQTSSQPQQYNALTSQQQYGQRGQARATNFVRNASSNDLSVVIKYTDTTGVRHNISKQVPIQFRSGLPTGGQNGGRYVMNRQQAANSLSSNNVWVLLFIGIVGSAGYYYWKKNKNKKSEK